MVISRRAEPRQIPSVPNSDGAALLGCCRGSAICRMALAAGDKVRLFDRVHDTDPTGKAKVPGNNGEVVEVPQVNDTGTRVRDAADNEGIVVCSRSIRGSIEASARLFRSHAAMVNVSQDVTPNRASPRRDPNRSKFGSSRFSTKSRHRNTKDQDSNRGDGDITRRTVIKIYRVARHAPLSLHERGQAGQLPHVRGVRTSGQTTDA